MLILVIGDIVGKAGRRAVRRLLPGLRQQYDLDLVIANGENAAGGFGLTTAVVEELTDAGVDVITSGNHIWAQKAFIPRLDEDIPVLRPLNYPPGSPGRGYLIQGRVMVVNLIGRTFIDNYDCPFRAMDKLLAEVDPRPAVVIVDFHAEATSEKVAMGWYLDGRVSAVLGTHTHVGTVDCRVLPRSTAYVTDIGMVGPADSIIGVEIDAVIQHFLTMRPHRWTVSDKGRVTFNTVILDVDESNGRATRINRIDLEVE